jgi:hypothetical protein
LTIAHASTRLPPSLIFLRTSILSDSLALLMLRRSGTGSFCWNLRGQRDNPDLERKSDMSYSVHQSAPILSETLDDPPLCEPCPLLPFPSICVLLKARTCRIIKLAITTCNKHFTFRHILRPISARAFRLDLSLEISRDFCYGSALLRSKATRFPIIRPVSAS